MPDDPNDASDRCARILKGAGDAFLRFGFGRTSLADIATNAGVSRTALYHYFPGKEDILRAVTEELHAGTLQAAAAALAAHQDLGAALVGLLDAKFGHALALMAGSSHATELVDATHRLSGPTTRAADAAFHRLVMDAFARHGRARDAEAVADTLIAAAKGLMRAGDAHVTPEQFRRRVERLVSWVVG